MMMSSPTVAVATNTKAARARAEQARRKLAEQDLITFCQYVDPEQEANYGARHLRLIAEYLEKAESGELWDGMVGDGKKILIISTPPRHWKSSLVSRKYPAWFVGKRTKEKKAHQVILTSYAASLAESNSRALLETIQALRLYTNIFPHVRLSEKSHAMDEWALAGEPFPTCVAAGVGGGLTGHGADLLIIDDPIKDRVEANSPASRLRLWSWWEDVARTRINPGGFCVIVMTRWHPDDIVGRLFAEQAEKGEERIVHLRLPALAETPQERMKAGEMGLPVDEADPLGRQPGQALWPGRVSADELAATKKVTPNTFQALYQGRPVPVGGWVVGREQFKQLPTIPKEHIRLVLGVDWAFTEKQIAPTRKEPDFTAVALVGLWTPAGNKEDARLVIAYLARKQANQHEARQFVKAQMQAVGKHIPMRSAQDGLDKLFLDLMRRDADLLGHSIKNLDRIPGDKMTKATPWLEMAHAGLVYAVSGPWQEEFFGSVELFPHGAHDDFEDAISVACHALGLGQKERKASSARVAGFGR